MDVGDGWTVGREGLANGGHLCVLLLGPKCETSRGMATSLTRSARQQCHQYSTKQYSLYPEIAGLRVSLRDKFHAFRRQTFIATTTLTVILVSMPNVAPIYPLLFFYSPELLTSENKIEIDR